MSDFVMIGTQMVRKTNILRVASEEIQLANCSTTIPPDRGYLYFDVVTAEFQSDGAHRVVRVYAPFGMDPDPSIDRIRCCSGVCASAEHAKAVVELAEQKLAKDLGFTA